MARAPVGVELSEATTVVPEPRSDLLQLGEAVLHRAATAVARGRRAAKSVLRGLTSFAGHPLSTTGDAIEFDTFEAWTVQRLEEEALGESGFAIVQAPPAIDPADGTLMRRLVRKRLKDAAIALSGVEADIKGVGLVAVYEYAEHETVGSFVKSVSPDVYAGLPLICALVDGEVRPIFLPR